MSADFEDMEIFHQSADISVLNPIYRMKYISFVLRSLVVQQKQTPNKIYPKLQTKA